MGMDGSWTYFGDHFALYTNTKSFCIPETNTMLRQL